MRKNFIHGSAAIMASILLGISAICEARISGVSPVLCSIWFLRWKWSGLRPGCAMPASSTMARNVGSLSATIGAISAPSLWPSTPRWSAQLLFRSRCRRQQHDRFRQCVLWRLCGKWQHDRRVQLLFRTFSRRFQYDWAIQCRLFSISARRNFSPLSLSLILRTMKKRNNNHLPLASARYQVFCERVTGADLLRFDPVQGVDIVRVQASFGIIRALVVCSAVRALAPLNQARRCGREGLAPGLIG